MKRTLASAVIAGLALALQGQAPLPPPPVTVDYCAFNPWSLTFATASIIVKYHVSGPVAADDVGFVVRWGDGYVSPAQDAGRFAPGTTIDHYLNFDVQGPITGETIQRVDVAVGRVHLTDGTLWDGPYTGAAPVRCEIYRGAGTGMP